MDKQLINNLITKIGQGDELAMTELYEGIKRQLFSFIFSFVKSKEKTEDLMQDTFIKLFEKPKIMTEKDNGFAYILTIARNLSLNHIKRESKMKISTSEELEFLGGSVEGTAFKNSMLKEFMSTLSEEERKVLILKELHGFTFDEIAKIMKIGIATAKRRMAEVKKKFKSYDTF